MRTSNQIVCTPYKEECIYLILEANAIQRQETKEDQSVIEEDVVKKNLEKNRRSKIWKFY